MNYDVPNTPFSKSVLAGLATGIIATLLNLFYNFIFRGITRLSLSVSLINVSTIIFATIILCIVAGLVYYFIVLNLKKSKVIFIALFFIVTVIGVWLGLGFHISENQKFSQQFDLLYIGMLIITGLCGIVLVPWLSSHKNPFFD